MESPKKLEFKQNKNIVTLIVDGKNADNLTAKEQDELIGELVRRYNCHDKLVDAWKSIGNIIAYLKTEDETIDAAYDLEKIQTEALAGAEKLNDLPDNIETDEIKKTIGDKC